MKLLITVENNFRKKLQIDVEIACVGGDSASFEKMKETLLYALKAVMDEEKEKNETRIETRH